MATRTVKLEIDASRSINDARAELKKLNKQLSDLLEDRQLEIDTGDLEDLEKDLNKSISSADSGIKDLNSRLGKLGSGAGSNLKKEFSKVNWKQIGSRAASTFKAAFTGAAIGIGVAAGALISSGIQDAVDLDSGARNIASLDVLNLEEVNAQLDEFAKATGRAKQEGIQPLYDTISAGVIPQKQFSEFLQEAQKFAIAGDLDDASEAVSVLNTALTQFGGEGITAANAADVFTSTVQGFRTDLGKLAPAFAEVAPAANIAGLGFAETNAALGLLSTNLAGDTQKAATSLNAALAELSNPASKAAKELKSLTGVRIDEFLADGNSLADVFVLLEQSADKSGGKITDFFGGSEAKNSVQNLTAESGKLQESIDLVNQAQKDGTATQKAYEENSESLKNQIALASGAFTNFKTDIGNAVLPGVTLFLEELSLSLQNLDTEELTNSFAELAPKLAEIAISFVEMAPTLLEITTNVLGLVVSLNDLGILGPTLIAGLGLKIIGLGNSFTIAKGLFKGFSTGLSLITGGGKGGGSGGIKGLTKGITKIAPLVTKFGGLLTNGIGKAVLKLAPKIAGLALSLGPAGLIAIGVIALGVIIFKNWDKIKKFFSKTFEIIKSIFRKGWDFVQKYTFLFGPIGIAISIVKNWGKITGFFKSSFSTINSLFRKGWNKAKSITKAVWEAIKGVFKAQIDSIKDSAKFTIDSIKDFFSFSGLSDSVRATFDRVSEALLAPLRKAKEAVDRIIGGIRDGLSSVTGGGIPFVPGAAIGAVMTGGIPAYAKGGINHKSVGSGLITRKPTYITSELGHTEAILAENTSIQRIESILARTNILGRLQDRFNQRLSQTAGAVVNNSSTRTRTTNNSRVTTIAPNVYIQPTNNRASEGEQRLSARQIGRKVAEEIFRKPGMVMA